MAGVREPARAVGPGDARTAPHLRPLTAEDRGWVREFMAAQAGTPRVVSRGVLHQVDTLPGFIASGAGGELGLLVYAVTDDQLEIVALYASRSGLGLGTALLAAAAGEAQRLGCVRLWLITTNDNEPAIRFYRARGMALAAVHRGALQESRRLKPEIPERGIGGVPIEDELEFELRLSR